MPQQLLQLTLQHDTPRLDLAVQALTQLPRAQVRGLFDHGCVQLDGRVCAEAGRPARAGQALAVRYDPQTRYKPQPRAKLSTRFFIAHEDAHLIVVEKVAGILTVPTDRKEENTLVHEVARYLSKGARITHRAHIVHRLDRDTSGLLVFGKSAAIAAALKDQFAARKPERLYAAIVAGQLREEAGTFRSFLATAADLDQYSTPDADAGKLAVTHFRVAARLHGATFVRVSLETGRRNQIRVHFAEAGHPVLGDVRYEVARARHPRWPHPRLALHAQSLGFTHPVTGKAIHAESALPAVFAQFLRETRL